MDPMAVLETVIGWDSTESLDRIDERRYVLKAWAGRDLPPTTLTCNISQSEWHNLIRRMDGSRIYPEDSTETSAMKLLLTHFDEIIGTMTDRFNPPYEISLEPDGLTVTGAGR